MVLFKACHDFITSLAGHCGSVVSLIPRPKFFVQNTQCIRNDGRAMKREK